MMCQAWMEENRDTLRFSLEVICYRSDKKNPETSNYKYCVGKSSKSKLVRPGKIIVRLKSELFDADIAAGEDTSLHKEECDFRGREFDKQFACKFREASLSTRGTFGKVIVERHNVSGNEPIFEFNLNKTGCEGEFSVPETFERWSVVAWKELAANQEITQDDNWEKFAKHLGFTDNEIAKLRYSNDPFLALVNMYESRGGTPEELVQGLYVVSREIKIGSSTNSRKRTLPTQHWMPSKRWRDEGMESDVSSNTASTSASRKRCKPTGNGSGSSKRRRTFSDVSVRMSSSQESLSTGVHIKDGRHLDEVDLWHISATINTQNWRALGRTLGLEECVLINIEHSYKTVGFRECAFQMLVEWKGRKPKHCKYGVLYQSLVKENMNNAAKQMATMKLSDNES
ncbi:hypothetical protein CHUAL_011718 [Chamberlinius hualienensis]